MIPDLVYKFQIICEHKFLNARQEKVVKSEIKLGLPFIIHDLVCKFT